MGIITYYGYADGSGEYYIVVDSDRCNGCGKCVEACPEKAIELMPEFIDLEDKTVCAIKEEHRKKIRYTCSGCKPESGQTPCVLSCDTEALKCIWKS